MSLQGGNDPQTRAVVQGLVRSVRELSQVSRRQLDTLTMDDAVSLRDALIELLPRTIELCDTRIKQSLSRAKVGRR